MPSQRRERVVSYNRMVKRTIVDGIRAVFTSAFAEKQLKSLRVTTEYPLTRTDYPAVYVRFNDREVRNAGVGHEEIFYDIDGVLRVWQHRLFEGTLDLVAVGLSPLDRDVVADAILEMLSFGQMPHMALQNNLFTRIYGDREDEENSPVLLRTLSHIALNTDRIQSGGESTGMAPWGAEDALVYEKTYSIEIHGGYYNAPPDGVVPGVDLVTSVHVYPHLLEQVAMPVWTDEDDWMPEMDEGALDDNVVFMTAVVSADESHETP